MGRMPHRLQAAADGRVVAVDGRDVAAWCGAAGPPDPGDQAWGERATAYVAAHPRAASAGVAPGQRLALLRRLAAGPASLGELLATLRTAVGWVGADDLENRLRDLRGGDRRAGEAHTGLPLRREGDRVWLAEPFPLLDEDDRRALGFTKAMIGQLDVPLAASASATLEHLLPGVAPGAGVRSPQRYQARAEDFARFEAAREERRAVQVRYFSLNSGRVGTYRLVPVEYVTVGATVKAICVQVGDEGRRVEDLDRQFALDRLLAVAVVDGQPATPAADLALRRSAIVLEMSEVLYEVLRQRDVFGLGTVEGTPLGYEGAWRVEGTFPMALSWDVMEQLCAWSGQVQVREPLWLVNAVLRRLRAGLAVMEEGGAFTLVTPEPGRAFASHEEAVRAEEPLPPPSGPRKLSPPGR